MSSDVTDVTFKLKRNNCINIFTDFTDIRLFVLIRLCNGTFLDGFMDGQLAIISHKHTVDINFGPFFTFVIITITDFSSLQKCKTRTIKSVTGG